MWVKFKLVAEMVVNKIEKTSGYLVKKILMPHAKTINRSEPMDFFMLRVVV